MVIVIVLIARPVSSYATSQTLVVLMDGAVMRQVVINHVLMVRVPVVVVFPATQQVAIAVVIQTRAVLIMIAVKETVVKKLVFVVVT